MSTALTSPDGRRARRLVLFVLIGAIVGFLVYRFIGCRTGTCAITSNPYISTIYGAVVGLLASGGLTRSKA